MVGAKRNATLLRHCYQWRSYQDTNLLLLKLQHARYKSATIVVAGPKSVEVERLLSF